ncbi:MAG: hypothetical protein AAF740_00235 [Bacteroidota bacterium]
MWSDRYFYWNICKDTSLHETVSTKDLISFINDLPETRKVSEFEFRNQPAFPFFSMVLLNAKNLTSWNGEETDEECTNLIAIVCAKGEKTRNEQLIFALSKDSFTTQMGTH